MAGTRSTADGTNPPRRWQKHGVRLSRALAVQHRLHATAALALAAVVGLSACGAGGGAGGKTAPDVKTLAAQTRMSAVVQTDKGPIKGVVESNVRVFQGVPYAKPPLGELRWASPQPAEPWTETLDAGEPGSICPQDKQMGTGGSENEDCLYLNVTAPVTDRKKLPVFVWIHGGVGVAGSGSEYDARRLATVGQMVVVTFNYRIGIFGTLSHPKLDASSETGTSGGFGSEDQRAVMRWVKANAAAFGGDPRNVTIAGEKNIGKYVPSYFFEFAEQITTKPTPPSKVVPGAVHGSDVPYLFEYQRRPAPFTAKQKRFAEKMIKYWANFAAKGNPNGSGLPEWPVSTILRGHGQSLDSDGKGIRQADLARAHKCQFWNELYPQ
ncbi:carboxylesterase family protein [Sinosporangium siamense]|uniref:Carboxylesterase type B domain-containing protein n=1 Tax=Sinosporangium siamense TaxID=1367973 RepID=A0A919V9Y8_9ACTN|nr:carboxylesterase family protein [Sinosporangium siamense]GII90574.1 hypothetical protein Ssi02_08050 [Sinosporangium siamense]